MIELHDKRVTQQAIAYTLKVNQSTIYKITKSNFIVGHKPGGGRKRITNCRNERTINRIVRKNRFSNSLLTRKVCLTLMSMKDLKDLEYVIRIPKRKPLLHIVQRKRRVQWAKE